jgi:hypothetical protein
VQREYVRRGSALSTGSIEGDGNPAKNKGGVGNHLPENTDQPFWQKKKTKINKKR